MEEETEIDKYEEIPPNADLKLFIKALERQTLELIEKFFQNRFFHCGGPIPRNLLLSRQSVDIVLSTEFLSGIDEVKSLLPEEEPPKGFNPAQIDWDTHRFLQLLNEVKRFGIPKKLQCGMMLLYMRFCMGIVFPQKKRELTNIMS